MLKRRWVIKKKEKVWLKTICKAHNPLDQAHLLLPTLKELWMMSIAIVAVVRMTIEESLGKVPLMVSRLMTISMWISYLSIKLRIS